MYIYIYMYLPHNNILYDSSCVPSTIWYIGN